MMRSSPRSLVTLSEIPGSASLKSRLPLGLAVGPVSDRKRWREQPPSCKDQDVESVKLKRRARAAAVLEHAE